MALTPREIGALVRQARTDAGITQDALATKIGASRYWVAEFEQGKPRAELGLALKAIQAIGLTLAIGREAGTRATAPGGSARADPLRDADPRVDLSRLLANATIHHGWANVIRPNYSDGAEEWQPPVPVKKAPRRKATAKAKPASRGRKS